MSRTLIQQEGTQDNMAGLATKPASPPRERAARSAGAAAYFDRLYAAVNGELGARVIEVGCGAGHFTRRLLGCEQVVALDPEPEKVARLLSDYGDRANLKAFSMEVTGARFRELAQYRPTSVVCLSGLERVEDHHRALFNMGSVLEPGGKIVLLVPAFPALYGRIDFSLGAYRRYTKESLAELAETVGLRVRQLRYSNVTGFFRWWFLSHIVGRVDPGLAEGEPGHGLIGRALSRIEAWLPPPFGQSLFAVLEVPR
jgi:SAM-dependent methyltransferase